MENYDNLVNMKVNIVKDTSELSKEIGDNKNNLESKFVTNMAFDNADKYYINKFIKVDDAYIAQCLNISGKDTYISFDKLTRNVDIDGLEEFKILNKVVNDEYYSKILESLEDDNSLYVEQTIEYVKKRMNKDKFDNMLRSSFTYYCGIQMIYDEEADIFSKSNKTVVFKLINYWVDDDNNLIKIEHIEPMLDKIVYMAHKNMTLKVLGNKGHFGFINFSDVGYYLPNESVVKVPSFVQWLCDHSRFDKIEVLDIREGNIRELVLPDMYNLQIVRIPNSVRIIGNNCFQDCRSLKEIIIPEGVTYIGENIIPLGKGLEKLVVPTTVKHITKMISIEASPNLVVYIPKHLEKEFIDVHKNAIDNGINVYKELKIY